MKKILFAYKKNKKIETFELFEFSNSVCNSLKKSRLDLFTGRLQKKQKTLLIPSLIPIFDGVLVTNVLNRLKAVKPSYILSKSKKSKRKNREAFFKVST